jgi:hypothetical protein
MPYFLSILSDLKRYGFSNLNFTIPLWILEAIDLCLRILRPKCLPCQIEHLLFQIEQYFQTPYFPQFLQHVRTKVNVLTFSLLTRLLNINCYIGNLFSCFVKIQCVENCFEIMCLLMVIMLQSLIYAWQDLFGDEHYFVQAPKTRLDGT